MHVADEGAPLAPEASARAASSWARAEGEPTPLGARWVEAERAFNFSLYSKHASGVTLLLYAPGDVATPVVEYPLDPRTHRSGRVWHCRLPEAELRGARYYAYRVAGPPPEGPWAWHAFDPDKVLLDPYARMVHFPPGVRARRGHAPRPQRREGPPRRPAGLPRRVRLGRRRAGPGTRPTWSIYELHVARLHPAPRLRRGPGAARDLRGPDREDPLPAGAGRHRGRADAGLPVGPAGGELLGLHAAQLLRPARRLRQPAGAQHDEFREMVGRCTRRASR